MGGLDIRQFPLILDEIDQGIFTVDDQNRITSFNQAAERITGFRAEEAIGKHCSQVFQTDHCESHCPLRRSIGRRQPVSRQEVHIQTRDGRQLETCVFAAPLVAASGALIGGIEVFHNLPRRDPACVEASQRPPGSIKIISRNPEMKRIIQQLQLVASSNSTLLITGDSGTGKEVIARAIHHHSARASRPFVAVNCAAMPQTLLESELFGYRKGAFTDARRDNPGRIARAEGGTLFLDEVGDLPVGLQVKLLRFLQDHVYEPLGSSEPVSADVRVVAATNRDLEQLVEEGRFRVDLYYRLNVFTIPLPPLCRRSEDIPQLVYHFIRRFAAETGKPIDSITEEALSTLLRYPWPGNIRELENAIEHAFILCQEFTIDVEHLPTYVQRSSDRAGPVAPVGSAPGPGRRAGGAAALRELEQQALRAALERHGGNRSAAARELGIHRTTLLRKLKRLGP